MGLIKHIIHHRGQATVLIRQAGLKVFGVYGSPKEDWIQLGIKNHHCKIMNHNKDKWFSLKQKNTPNVSNRTLYIWGMIKIR